MSCHSQITSVVCSKKYYSVLIFSLSKETKKAAADYDSSEIESDDEVMTVHFEVHISQCFTIAVNT